MSGGTCHYCARHDCICTPPTRDWKPVVGEKVLVEATVTRWASDSSKYVWVNVDDEHILVPLSSIRPMRKEGE